MKVACTVWGRGKAGDNIKILPIAINRDEYYSIITAVFQNDFLLPVSVARNITFTSDEKINWERLNYCIEKAELEELITELPDGLNTMLVPSLNKDGVELSGGERQKLMLARALYKNASLLILDEPTAALDPIAENRMYLRYNEFSDNKTVVFISHRLASTKFCDRIIYLDNKAIAEQGTHDVLIAQDGKYRKIFDIQSQYYQ